MQQIQYFDSSKGFSPNVPSQNNLHFTLAKRGCVIPAAKTFLKSSLSELDSFSIVIDLAMQPPQPSFLRHQCKLF